MDLKLLVPENIALIISNQKSLCNKFKGFKYVTVLQIQKCFHCKGLMVNNEEIFLHCWPYCLEGILRTQMKITFGFVSEQKRFNYTEVKQKYKIKSNNLVFKVFQKELFKAL